MSRTHTRATTPERAFAPHHDAAQVVAGSLGPLAAEPLERAVGQHDVHRQHVGRRHAVREAVRAAGVRVDVAADRRRLLRRRVRCVGPARGPQRRRQIQVEQAGLNPGESILGSHLQDAVHLRRDDARGRRRGGWSRRPGPSRTRAARPAGGALRRPARTSGCPRWSVRTPRGRTRLRPSMRRVRRAAARAGRTGPPADPSADSSARRAASTSPVLLDMTVGYRGSRSDRAAEVVLKRRGRVRHRGRRRADPRRPTPPCRPRRCRPRYPRAWNIIVASSLRLPDRQMTAMALPLSRWSPAPDMMAFRRQVHGALDAPGVPFVLLTAVDQLDLTQPVVHALHAREVIRSLHLQIYQRPDIHGRGRSPPYLPSVGRASSTAGRVLPSERSNSKRAVSSNSTNRTVSTLVLVSRIASIAIGAASCGGSRRPRWRSRGTPPSSRPPRPRPRRHETCDARSRRASSWSRGRSARRYG